MSQQATYFDNNWAEVKGSVIWTRPKNDNILVRMVIENSNLKITLALPNGQVDGRDTSILIGDNIRITGYIKDVSYPETLAQFIARSERPDLLDQYQELKPHSELTIKRALTCIVPEEKESGEVEEGADTSNYCRVEGVLYRSWNYGKHKYCRLGIYDRHTNTENEKRVPHFLTVQFTNGEVAGKPIKMSDKNHAKPGDLIHESRLRVSGRLINRIYWETLRDFLTDAKRIDILETLRNPEELAAVKARYLQTSLEAINMIQYN